MSLTKQDEIERFLGCLRGANTADRGTKFRKALFEVLTQIWDEVEDEVHKIGAIIFADISSLFLLYCPHRPSKKEVCIVEKHIIFFPDILCDEPESEIKHTIAHEFAHFMLGHEEITNCKEHEKGERAADELAAKWGFPKKRRLDVKRKKLRLPTVEAPETCAWCDTFIGPDQPASAVSATSFFDLRPKGEWVEIDLLSGERIVAGIPGKHSQARKDGWDIFFEVCSPDCARRLDIALRQNTEAFFKELKIERLKRKRRR